MRFLHAADIHLDSPLAGLADRVDLPPHLVRHCTRRAFEAMIQLAIDEDVAFVVIAGDLYDRDWRDFSTGLFLAEQMQRLGRPAFLLRGNHDAASVITRELRPPANVREFSSRRCETFELPELRVALHGHSFPNREVPEDLSASYPPARAGWLNIGVLHTSAEDPGEHATYAPCTAAGLAVHGYDYWALGHIHARRVLQERPWIVFPGNLQGRHARECGPRGCTLVTVEDGAVVAVEHRPVDVLRWTHLTVDAGVDEWTALNGRIDAAVRAALDEAEDRPVLARLTLAGESPIHAALVGNEARIAAEARVAAIVACGQLWAEKVRVTTRPPRGAAAGMESLRLAFEAGLEDPEVVAALLRELQAVRARLPGEMAEPPALPRGVDELRALAGEAWALALQALEGRRE